MEMQIYCRVKQDSKHHHILIGIKIGFLVSFIFPNCV